MKILILITLGVMFIVALGRYCWWQIRRVQRAKQYVSEAYRRYLLSREECFPDIDSSWKSEHPDRRAAVGLHAAIDGAEGDPKGSRGSGCSISITGGSHDHRGI